MTKKVGRNDPCPCGSGKKYKNCCGAQVAHRRKFQASVLSSGAMLGKTLEQRASKISTNFFSKPQPIQGEPRKFEANKPHHPPEADKPM